MGKLDGFRQVTLYVNPELYERVRCSSYSLGEDIYEFVDEALASAIERRIPKAEQPAINLMSRQNIKNGKTRRPRRGPPR